MIFMRLPARRGPYRKSGLWLLVAVVNMAVWPLVGLHPGGGLAQAQTATPDTGSEVCLDARGTVYRRPYGPKAPWNVPVRGLPRDAKSALYVERLWEHGSNEPGNVNLSFDEYTYPVYEVADATGYYPVSIDRDSPLNGDWILWNPAWQPASGSDGQVILLDPATGREWNLWQVRFADGMVHATNGNQVPGSYWLREVGFVPSRGAGIPYLAMLVRPAEVACGRIGHALSMPIVNTDGEFSVAPATALEYEEHGPGGVPEGMRFALDVTDEDITAWIESLPRDLPPATARSARVIAEALRDYGWFITDSSGGAHLQFEDRLTAGAAWATLGLDKHEIGGKVYPRDLLDGLVRKERIFALVPSDQYPERERARMTRSEQREAAPVVGAAKLEGKAPWTSP
jgi:hypothetical protein